MHGPISGFRTAGRQEAIGQTSFGLNACAGGVAAGRGKSCFRSALQQVLLQGGNRPTLTMLETDGHGGTLIL